MSTPRRSRRSIPRPSLTRRRRDRLRYELLLNDPLIDIEDPDRL